MTTITGIGPGPLVGPAAARGASGSAFEVPLDSRTRAAAPAAAAPPIGAMLMLQEQEVDRLKDREARRRGMDGLAALRALQAALLAGRMDPALMDQIRRICSGPIVDCEPGLREILSSILLRARIEMTRHELLR